ncbi:MAG: SDR family oxidoreductase [Dehalococcoidia bacterium]
MNPLEGKVALVAGATRGAGRGIAVALGEAGATVYCTGRSTRSQPGNRPETIDETAELVAAAGGQGIAVRTDHTVEDEVRRLIERVDAEQGRLDILVNDVWGGDELTEFGKPFWEVSLANGRRMLDQALFSHVITSHCAAPLLQQTGGGLIVEITDGDSFGYRGNIFYDLVKTSVIRLAFIMSKDLRSHGITSLAVTPGFLRSEAMLELFGVTEANWQQGTAVEADFIASETPLFVGRAVAAVAADPNRHAKDGRVFSSWGLSDEYGFLDAHGDRPHWGRYFQEKYGAHPVCDDTFYRYWENGPLEIGGGLPQE